MRIIFVFEVWYPIIGGTQTYIESLGKYLLDNKIVQEIELVTSGYGEKIGQEKFYPGFTITYLGSKKDSLGYFGRWRWTWQVVQYLKNKKGVIQVNSYYSALAGWLLRVFYKKKVFLMIHTFFGIRGWQNLTNYFLGIILGVAEWFFYVVLKFDEVTTVDLQLAKDKKIKFLSPIAYKLEKKDFNSRKKVKNILYVGRDSKQKGVNLIYQLVDKYLAYFIEKNIKINLVGPENRKSNQVINVLGRKPFEQMVEIYQQNDLFLFTSLVENFGIVLLEAKRYGLGIVASQTVGSQYLLQKDKDAFLFEPGNIDQMFESIKKFVENVDLLQKMTTIWRQDLKKRFGEEKVWGKYVEIYKRMEDVNG